ncbi:MAG TPA: glycosyltransferase [Desulfocapsa sulfexigens]|nr:glycosyltransferase [Desulfocapsa sulfexigens]
MKVLLLAPQPFFINRGTPIDVLLVLRALSERDDMDVDAIVYPEGEDVVLPHVTLHRVPVPGNTKGTRPGLSLKKLWIDFFMLIFTWKMVHRNRYDIIHAGEETVFIAMLMKLFYKIPYVYDIDSSNAQQLIEKCSRLKFMAPVFNFLEGRAIRGALANAPVCNALAELCEKNGSNKTVTVHDISQLENPDLPKTGSLSKEINAPGLILLYCGNLETYQGVDLLVESFPYVTAKNDDVQLVIIGGIPEDIAYYKEKASALGVADRVHFLGPRPFSDLDKYLAEADILAAPRTKGVNTPMKIFPYMHSGKPVILTKLYTHTQIVTSEEAYLADAEPEPFGKGILELAEDQELREKLGRNGRAFVEKDHVYAAHKRRVDELYDWVKAQITN